MHCHSGTNNRGPRWTFTGPCKPEARPDAQEESASPAYIAAPAMKVLRRSIIVFSYKVLTKPWNKISGFASEKMNTKIAKGQLLQSFAQFRTFAQFRIIQIEEYVILLNDSAGEFKLLLEKVHSLTDIFI